MSIGGIFNLIELSERLALSGQPTEEQFLSVRAAGYEVVVNLAPSIGENALPNEARLLADLGLEYHHIPVSWISPESSQFELFTAIMDKVADRRTLLHCAANFRVTAFYSLYAMARHGWQETRADALMDRIWKSDPSFQMSDAWKQLIAEIRQGFARAG